MNPARILCLDDDATSIMMLVTALEKLPYQVYLAQNGTVAMHMTLNHTPSLLLIDLGLPDINGFELIQSFQAFKETKDIPFVIVSSDKSDEAKAQGLVLGAKAYLEK